MPFRRFLIPCLLVAGLAGAGAQADSRQEWSEPSKKWIKGPVRCLVTEDEEKQFKTLQTDEERGRFIQEFWERRDPTPGTPANEFEEFFWKRVAEADKRFVQTTESGAQSDRGQVFILFGLPTRIAPPGKNVEWVYEKVPNIIPSSFHILFHAVGAGNFLLLGRKEVDQIISQNLFLRGLGEQARAIYAPPPPEVAALPAAQAAPPPEAVPTEEQKILEAALAAGSLPSDLPLLVRTDIYEAIGGDSFVAITAGIPREAASGGPLVVFARVIPEGDATPVTLAAADSFSGADPENGDPASRHLLFQGGTGLHPGRYSLVVGVRNPQSGKVGMVRQPLEVPSYSGGFAWSTLTLTRKLERLPAPPSVAGGKKVPFVLGAFRVVPCLEPVLKQGADMAWYFQIYNASPDPVTGRPNLTIQYDFLLQQKGEYRQVTAPQVFRNRESQVEAFSFPLVKPTEKQKGWVAGNYKLVIKVTDEVSKASVSQELLFSVVP
ncbi:MAG TPA: GWxTD domain-containing protein [Candidatus Polarisedimenticolia bacterium]|nr:GWxTD domain-containing protein [Candidatus Polarisedimenticolia bacterium]